MADERLDGRPQPGQVDGNTFHDGTDEMATIVTERQPGERSANVVVGFGRDRAEQPRQEVHALGTRSRSSRRRQWPLSKSSP